MKVQQPSFVSEFALDESHNILLNRVFQIMGKKVILKSSTNGQGSIFYKSLVTRNFRDELDIENIRLMNLTKVFGGQLFVPMGIDAEIRLRYHSSVQELLGTMQEITFAYLGIKKNCGKAGR